MAEHCDKHGLDYWPKRNDPLRATVVPQLSKTNKDEMNNNTLSRCRSLEFLEDRNLADRKPDQVGKGNLHRSFDLLNNIERHKAIIHHNMTDADTSKSSSMQHSTNTSESGRKSSKQCSLDFREKYGDTHSTISDAESLEDFSNKTKDIIQMKRASRQKFKERTMNELRTKMDDSFLKYPPNFSSTLTSNSIDDLRNYHSPHHYPNDFDDISVEMKNITKLLSASLIEPLESAPSTSSSFYQRPDKFQTKRFTLYDKDHVDRDNEDLADEDVDDDDSSIKSELELNASNSFGSQSTDKSRTQAKPFTANGFFQNTCFENRSSSSCDTLKSVELPKTNGQSNINGNDNAEEEEEGEEEEEEVEEESDTDLEEVVDVQIKVPAHLQTFNHRGAPRPGLVSARIKSLLAKNLQTNNKMPTVRSTLAGGASNFKSSKLLRVPLKQSDSPKSQTSTNTPQNIVSPVTVSTKHTDGNGFKKIDAETLQAIGDLPRTEAIIHTTDSNNDIRTNTNDI